VVLVQVIKRQHLRFKNLCHLAGQVNIEFVLLGYLLQDQRKKGLDVPLIKFGTDRASE
jgi:hypothetical protein